MKVVKGRYNDAIVFSNKLDKKAEEQIEKLCSQEFVNESKIRVMPDVHAGAGCTIGTTLTISDKVVPNLVGVDIGCGMEVTRLKDKEMDFGKLDKGIYNKIPSGFKVRKTEHEYNDKINLNLLHCKEYVDLERARKSIGSLGGGNHFIEINTDLEGNLYLVVHSGSRHLGNQVASLYQAEACRSLSDEIKNGLPKDLAYLQGHLFNQYIHDMKIVQKFADINRKAIVQEILTDMGLTVKERFTTIHNYIDTEEMILRKGAVSAKEGEKFIIPINMQEGSILAVGKGNKDWNYSGPHGAGRVMSRMKARKNIKLRDYKDSMAGVFTSSVNKATLDEAPMAYKPITEIIENIIDTAEVVKIIRPLYNFKAAE